MRLGLREIIFVAVLLGLPVAAFTFVFQPINEQVEQVRTDNQAKQAKLERLEVARQLDDVSAEIARLSEAIEVFEAKLPAEKEVEVILREVWQTATSRGLRPRSVRTDKPVDEAMYSELPIRMEILGDFDAFYGFVLDLERLSRITRIKDMKLEQMSDYPGHVKAAFTLTIYFEAASSDRPNA